MLPSAVQDCVKTLQNSIAEIWECYTPPGDDPAWDTLLTLVKSFGEFSFGSDAHRRSVWLAVFAARRALPCWELYCDGTQPHEAITAVIAWLNGSGEAVDCVQFEQVAVPTYKGRRLNDCRESDTGYAAEAAALAAKVVNSVLPEDASLAVHFADGAFDCSPLRGENFRKWLLEVAVPAAYDQRELNEHEQQSFRDFPASEIPKTREAQASYWNRS